MLNISAILIVLNEEKHIISCLKTLAFCQEAIIVDAFSQDRTVELAQSFPFVRVFQQEWQGYAQAKQFAIEKAENDWIFWIDADERVSNNLAQSISSLKKKPEVISYSCNRKNFFLGKWLRHGGWYPDRVVRLFHRKHAKIEERAVHEKVVFQGSCEHLTGDLVHFAYDSLAQYFEKQQRYASLWATAQGSRQPLPLFMLPLRLFSTFVIRYIYKQGFRDGSYGFVASLLATYATLYKELILWERELKK